MNLSGKVIDCRYDDAGLIGILFKGRLPGYGFDPPVFLHLGVVNSLCKLVQYQSRPPELSNKFLDIISCKVTNGPDPKSEESGLGLFPNPGDFSDRQRVQELPKVAGSDDGKAVRFFKV